MGRRWTLQSRSELWSGVFCAFHLGGVPLASDFEVSAEPDGSNVIPPTRLMWKSLKQLWYPQKGRVGGLLQHGFDGPSSFLPSWWSVTHIYIIVFAVNIILQSFFFSFPNFCVACVRMENFIAGSYLHLKSAIYFCNIHYHCLSWVRKSALRCRKTGKITG